MSSMTIGQLAQVEERMGDLERMRAALRSLVRQCDAGRPRSCAIIESFSGHRPATSHRKRRRTP